MLRNRRGQWGLVELLAVVVIIAILAVVFLPRYLGGGATNPNAPAGKGGTPKQRAQSVQCMTNLRQIRSAIDMYRQTSENGRNPASFAEMESSGVYGEITKCPISGQTYNYDPTSGKVSCSYPGHEQY